MRKLGAAARGYNPNFIIPGTEPASRAAELRRGLVETGLCPTSANLSGSEFVQESMKGKELGRRSNGQGFVLVHPLGAQHGCDDPLGR